MSASVTKESQRPRKGMDRAFSCDRMAAPADQAADLDQQLEAQEAHIVHQRPIPVPLLVPNVRVAQELTQRLVLVRQFVETAEVAGQSVPAHAHHQNPPHLHARTPHGPVDPRKDVPVHDANRRSRKSPSAKG